MLVSSWKLLSDRANTPFSPRPGSDTPTSVPCPPPHFPHTHMLVSSWKLLSDLASTPFSPRPGSDTPTSVPCSS